MTTVGRSEATAWTRVATMSDLLGKRQLACNIKGLELLLLKVGSDVIVLHNYCTHLGKPLTGGRVMGGQITCPFHGACFDLRTGESVSGPAVHPLRRFAARFEGDCIVADLSIRPDNVASGCEGIKVTENSELAKKAF